MKTPPRLLAFAPPRLLAFGALLMSSAALAGCGGVPGDSVAVVDGTGVEKTEYDRFVKLTAGPQAQAGVPDPPAFTKCVAGKRKALPKPAKGQPAQTDQQLKDQCKQEHETLRDNALGTLVNTVWIEKEAEAQDVKVSDAEVRKSFDTQKKQQFPKDADYKAFLKQSGQTEAQLLAQVRTGELARKITEKITKGKDKVSDAEVKAFYEDDKNSAQFGTPETRDAHVVLTKTKAKAEQARQAVEGGQSWSQVAKRYSVDPTTKAQGGKLAGVAKGTQDKGFETALFAADKGKVTGPVKTQFGYYVFEVDKTTKAQQQTLAQAQPVIRQTLVEQKKQKAIEGFVKTYTTKWRDKTECREGYKVPDLCKNAAKPKASPTPTPAG